MDALRSGGLDGALGDWEWCRRRCGPWWWGRCMRGRCAGRLDERGCSAAVVGEAGREFEAEEASLWLGEFMAAAGMISGSVQRILWV